MDSRISYAFPYGIRLYGGGGGMFHREPKRLKPWYVQYGIELRSLWKIPLWPLRPVAAIDFQNYEENSWTTDISARFGVEFKNFSVQDRNLQLLRV